MTDYQRMNQLEEDIANERQYANAPTPRTDAALEWTNWNGNDVMMVPYDFARELEKDLYFSRIREEKFQTINGHHNTELDSLREQLATAKAGLLALEGRKR